MNNIEQKYKTRKIQRGKNNENYNNLNSDKRNNTGITLVALVITIIVLLILAGVTISLTLGENGLLRRAQESANAHKHGEENDIAFMNNAYKYMEQYFNVIEQDIDLSDITPPEVNHTIKKVEKKIIEPQTPEGGQLYTDTDGAKVPIPAGFEYKEGTKQTGLVITDNAKINEFVWVPVEYVVADSKETIEEKTKDLITIQAIDKESNIKSIENITKENIKNIGIAQYEVFKNGEYIFRVTNNANKYTDYTVTVDDIIATGNGAMAILQEGSSENYQGVLYEFSETTATMKEIIPIGSTSGFREPDVVTEYDNETNLEIINNILGTEYATNTETARNQFKADMQKDFNSMIESVKKYKGFYVGRYEVSIDLATKRAYSKVGVFPATAATTSANTWYGLYAYQKKMAETNGYTSVESNMIWGSNYDAMLRWALTGADATKVTSTENAAHNLTEKYETGKQTIAGKVDRINNIYDLGGNCTEWTAEAWDISNRTNRGCGWAADYTPSYRHHYSDSAVNTLNFYSSRPILYVK